VDSHPIPSTDSAVVYQSTTVSCLMTLPHKVTVASCHSTHSIIEASLVSSMWSVRIHGTDISMGNYKQTHTLATTTWGTTGTTT